MSALAPRVLRGLTPVAALATLLLTSPDLRAQESEATHVVTGSVVDAATGEPVDQAMVSLEDMDWGVFTDEDGTFRIEGVAAGSGTLLAERLGYRAGRTPIVVGEEGPASVTVRLEPDPVLVEGVRVVTNRFQRRRNATATSVSAFEQDDLLSSPYLSVTEFIEARAGVPIVSCPSYMHAFNCALVRGRRQPVSVYIDEAPVFAGLDQLDAYLPGDLYMLEVYARGRHIRAYTNGFMERAAKRRIWPIPLFF